MSLDALAAASADADRAVRDLEYEIDAKAREAASAVRATFRDQLATLRATRAAASKALDDARVEAAISSNPMIGRKVQKTFSKPVYRGSYRSREVIGYGIFEVCTSTTVFPSNQRHWLPDIGETFIRLLKKDGTPSLKIDRQTTGWVAID